MAQYYMYGNESQSQSFSSYNENQCLSNEMASGQSYYTKPAMPGSQQTRYYGRTTNPALGYNHSMGMLPATGYQQASYSNNEMCTNTNPTQGYGHPVTGYHGNHHESHVKKTFRKEKYRDGFSSVEYTSCSDSESDDEGCVRRCF